MIINAGPSKPRDLGRLLRFEQPIAPDPSDPAADLSVRYETITIWEPPGELLAMPASAFVWLGQMAWADRRVAEAVITWAREGGMPVDEACGYLYGVYTGHAGLVFQILAHRADVLRHQQIADAEARLRAHREAAREVAS